MWVPDDAGIFIIIKKNYNNLFPNCFISIFYFDATFLLDAHTNCARHAHTNCARTPMLVDVWGQRIKNESLLFCFGLMVPSLLKTGRID